jgi:PAS domain S-box-containing protein
VVLRRHPSIAGVRGDVVVGRRSTYSRRVATAAEFLARILDGAPQPVWVVDEEGLIVFANPAAVTVLGYDDAAQLYRRPSHATVHYRRPDGSPYPQDDCPMLKPRQTGETVHGEEWFLRRDGSMFPIAWWSAPIAMANGNGAVLAFSDITERLAAEQAVRDRDAAEVRAAESRAAQRRIVENSAAVRRQVVRDLHDGAQQRLITMLISLQLAREEVEADPAGARRLLDDAVGQAQAAIDELRELAAGLHPPVLTYRGLVAAIEELAARAALPVVVTGSLPGRLAEAVETNAYFFVAEALTNAVKHSGADRAEVCIGVDDLTLSVEVRDDGIGGAAVDGSGSGLAGLADRVGALGGRMDIASPKGCGTTVRAEIPVDHAGS